MADVLSSGFVLIRLEASYPAECCLEPDGQPSQTMPSVRQLHLGGAGTILKMHESVEAFGVGDAVVACLSEQVISTDSHGEELASVHESLLSRLPTEASKHDAARIPMAFAIATAVLHNTGIISMPLRSTIERQLPLRNILVVASNTVVPLMIIKLLRLYTVSTVFIVYEADTTQTTAVSIDPAMIAGAHFAQQTSASADLSSVARGLRSNLGHYGPYSGTGCFDLVFNLTKKADTPEPYRRLLCPETGRLFQMPQTMHIDFEWLFVKNGIMAELDHLLKEGNIKAENLYVHSQAQPSENHERQNIHAENDRSETAV